MIATDRPAVRRDRRRGAAVVETAFVLPIILLFVFGVLEYGRFLMFMHVASNATAGAARYAVVHTGDGTTQTQVVQKCADGLAGTQSMLTTYQIDVFAAQPGTTPPTPVGGSTQWNDAPFGTGICVRITGTYEFVAIGLLGVGPLPINVSAVMTSEAN